MIKQLLLNSGVAFKERFSALIAGKSIDGFIDENFVFSDLKKNNEAAIWTLFLMAGYLKSISSQTTDLGFSYQLTIPNLEVRYVYQKVIIEWLANGYGLQWYTEFLQRLLDGNMAAFENDLTHLLEKTVSVHDVGVEPEAFYHGLMIGLTASLYSNPNYETKSNRESGYGRYDFMIFSRNPEKLTLLFEFKKIDLPKGKKNIETIQTTLNKAAQEALVQIEQQVYFAEAKQRGVQRLLKIGIAFSGKQFGMAFD